MPCHALPCPTCTTSGQNKHSLQTSDPSISKSQSVRYRATLLEKKTTTHLPAELLKGVTRNTKISLLSAFFSLLLLLMMLSTTHRTDSKHEARFRCDRSDCGTPVLLSLPVLRSCKLELELERQRKAKCVDSCG